MRVVGGRLRGRPLAAPKSTSIRPTADRLRESLFNILRHAYGDPIGGARVLDLFAGTGALGIEAASHGAAFVLFVDDGAEARALIRENVAALGLGGTHAACSAATPPSSARRIRSSRSRSSSSIRPMAKTSPNRRSPRRAKAAGFAPEALIVVEEATKARFAAPEGFTELERRAYDDTEFIFLRFNSA